MFLNQVLKSLVVGGALSSVVFGQTAQDIHGDTKTNNPERATAKVLIRPAYYSDPDGVGTSSNIAGRWDFEDAASDGPYVKSAGSATNLTATVPAGGTIGTVAGGVSRALQLNGGSYISGTLSGGTNRQFAVSLWFKPNAGSHGSIQTICRIDDFFSYSSGTWIGQPVVIAYTGGHITIRSRPLVSGQLPDAIYSVSPSVASAVSGSAFNLNFVLPASLDDGTWHHLVVTFDGTYSGTTNNGGPFAVYLNGNAAGNRLNTANNVAYNPNDLSGAPRVIGTDFGVLNASKIHFGFGTGSPTSPAYPFYGQIDRARVYGKNLSVAEVGTLMNANIDGDGYFDRVEVNTPGYDALDPAVPGSAPVVNDDQGLVASTSAKGKLGRWDFEKLTGAGRVQNLQRTDGNGDLALAGATLDNGHAMPSRSARFGGNSLMRTEDDLVDWGGVSNHSVSFWMRAEPGGSLSNSAKRHVIWNLTGLHGGPQSRVMFTVGQSPTTLKEQFEVISISDTVPADAGALSWIPANRLGVAEGGWFHVTLVKSSGAYSLYINGQPMGTPITTGYTWWQGQSFDGTGMRLEVGGSSSYPNAGYAGFEGNIDRLRFWSQPLTQADASNMYLQDYDGDTIPDVTEVMDAFLDPMLHNSPTIVEPLWDQQGISGTDPNTNQIAYWNFETFRYGASGRYFSNFPAPSVLQLWPNSGVTLSSSEAIASNYATFSGLGYASTPLGSRLAGKGRYAITGWLKVARGAIWDTPNVPTPLWEIKDYGPATTDSVRLYAIQQGAYTQFYLCNFNPSTGANGPGATRWLLPRSQRLDNGDWHHLVFQKEQNNSITTHELYLDGVKLEKIPTPGYSEVSIGNFTNTGVDSTVFRVGSALIAGKEYPFNGGWDRIRLYDYSLTQPRIDALLNQDADQDGVADRFEYGVVGRSAIDPGDSGVIVQPGLDLSKVDIEGVPSELTDDPALLGLWDFESLDDRGAGFLEFKGRSPLIPVGSANDVGLDFGSGVPSRSAFLRDGGYLSASATSMVGKTEFSMSFWMKAAPASIDRNPLGFSIASLDDLLPGTGNTLTLRLQKAGASQALIVQPFNNRTAYPSVAPGGVGWSLVNKRLDDGVWHHVTWVRHRSGSALYVDGALLTNKIVGSGELLTKLAVPAGGVPKLVLGRTTSRAPELSMDGNIDRFRLYGRALNQGEIGSLYNQDFDRDGFSDIYEMETEGFDPIRPPATAEPGTVEFWDDDTGLSNAAALKSGLTGAWNFETTVTPAIGDSASSIRFPAEMPDSPGEPSNEVGEAIADGGVIWDRSSGMLSKSLAMSRDSYLKMPPQILGESGSSLTASFWVKIPKNEIFGQAESLKGHSNKLEEKIALLTLGAKSEDLPAVIVSIDRNCQIVAETQFARTYTAGAGYTNQTLGTWQSPAKLDDGRWHHIVINLRPSGTNIWVDAFNASAVGTIGNFAGYGPISLDGDPYFWLGFRRNVLLDPMNILTSQLPYLAFTGAIDRVRIYNRSLIAGEIESLYGQDRDEDTIPDVTEVNSRLDPYTPQIVDPNGDYDLDGLTNAEEATLGTSWWKPDSDGDWLFDGWEDFFKTGADTFKPLVDDTGERDNDHDGDGLTGYQEFELNTDPNNSDTDGDGINDFIEFQSGTDPLDSFSTPGTVPTGGQMTRGGIQPTGPNHALPGGSYEANLPPTGDPSYSYNGQDATGPRFRKVGLNGRPLADQAPESNSETDRNAEETYVDAFSLSLRHDNSLIYVPVPASDLKLQVTMSTQEESWNSRSGIRPHENLTSPFGPTWSSNISAYIQETTEIGGSIDIGATPSPRFTYSAVDEDGRSLKFGSYDGAVMFAYPSSLSDRKSYHDQLRRSTGDLLVIQKKFGTTLTYEKTDLDQAHYSNRSADGKGSSFILHRYYRLISVEDRYGNKLRYSYPTGHKKTLIPWAISVVDRPDMRIEVTIDPLDPHRVKSIKDPRGYSHTFEYASKVIPNGNFVGAGNLDVLTSVEDPLGFKTSYGYDAGFEIDPINPTSYFCLNLSAITNKRGVTSTIAYEVDDDKFRSTLQVPGGRTYNRIYGLPRLVKRIRNATTVPSGMSGSADVEQIAEFARTSGLRWIYSENGVIITSGGGKVIPTNAWTNSVTNGVGDVTTYRFTNIDAILADTDTHGSSMSLNWLIYYTRMDIIHPDTSGTEIYRFDISSGLSLESFEDISGNRTFYSYAHDTNKWNGLRLVPSNSSNLMRFSYWSDPVAKTDALQRPERYQYSSNYRVMSHHEDVHGTITRTGVDSLGRRTGMEVKDAAGNILSEESYNYHPQFRAFMTSKTVRAFVNKSGYAWEQGITTLYEPDSHGRLYREAIDINRNGSIDAGVDLITTHGYDRNGNKVATTDGRGAVTEFGYDPLNRLTLVTYPPADGPARTLRSSKIFLYDSNGNKHAEIDERGYATMTRFDALNRISQQIRDMDGVGLPGYSVLTDSDGRSYCSLASEGFATPEDLTTHNTYNDVGSVVVTINPKGVMTFTSYDALQRPLTVWENFSLGDTMATFIASSEKALTLFEYEKEKNTGSSAFAGDGFKPTRITRVGAVRMSTGYNENLEVTASYDKVYRPLSETIEFEPGRFHTTKTEYYDAAYQTVKTVAFGEAHAQRTLVQYDGLGRELETTVNEGGALPAKTTKFYSSTGLLYRVTDPLGRSSETDYDGAGRPVIVWQARSDLSSGDPGFGEVDRVNGLGDEVIGSARTITEYDANGNAVATIDPRGQRWDFTFDARNRKIGELQPAVDADGNPDTPGTTRPSFETQYDAVGNVVAQRDARSNWTRSFYDRANRLWFTRVNPSNGNPSPLASPTANATFDIVTVQAYDKNGNIVAATDGNGNITRNAYNALNRLVITATDPTDGNPSDPNAAGYNPLNHQNGASFEIVVVNDYDDAGNLVQVTDGKAQSTAFRYDGLGRKTRTIWDIGKPLERVEQFEFNSVYLIARVDPKGQRTEYGYDSLYRNTSVEYIGRTNDDRLNDYDLVGNLLSVTYPNEITARKDARGVNQTFDALNRLRTETSNGRTHVATYDKSGNRLSIAYQGGRTIVSTYDALNRLATATESTSVTEYGYDLGGNVTYKKLPNNVVTLTMFDALNRRLTVEDKVGTTTLSKFDYSQTAEPGLHVSGYDKVGNVRRVHETYTRTELKNRYVINTYDATNRLTTETLDETAAAGMLTATTYGYDKANNRTKKVKVVGTSTAENLLYIYGDGSNASGGNSNQLTGYGTLNEEAQVYTQTHTYTYDANGNRATRSTSGLTDTYGYDFDNRLVTLDHQTPAVDTERGEYRYAYDHRSRRVTRDESSIPGRKDTSISFSAGVSVQEFSETTITRHYIRGSDWGGGVGGVLYSMDSGLVPLFDHYNARGDVIGQTNSNAGVTWQAAYEAYGTKKEGGNSPTRQKANTKDEDPHGLLNEGFRYRDLETGVFITRDPAGFIDGPNVYTYVNQNPWSAFDPDGLFGVMTGIGLDSKTGHNLHQFFTRFAAGYRTQGSGALNSDVRDYDPRYKSQAASPERAGEIARDIVNLGGLLGTRGRPVKAPTPGGPNGLVPVTAGGPAPVAVPANPPVILPVPVIVNPNFSGNEKPGGNTAKDDNEASSAEGSKYGNLPDPKNVGAGKDFTRATKRKILEQNRSENDGVVKSDKSGAEAVPSQKSQKGVTPPTNEAQVDHIIPKSKGGTNSPRNAQVLTREENRAKSNN